MTEFTSEGALYELIARGNKDVYFQSDTLTAQSPFRNNYKRIPAYVHELRKIPPTNNTDFNKTIEFNFEVAGDIYTHPTLLIDLPTWLPNNQTYTDINNIQQPINYNKSRNYEDEDDENKSTMNESVDASYSTYNGRPNHRAALNRTARNNNRQNENKNAKKIYIFLGKKKAFICKT
jgi:hypothetical protein